MAATGSDVLIVTIRQKKKEQSGKKELYAVAAPVCRQCDKQTKKKKDLKEEGAWDGLASSQPWGGIRDTTRCFLCVFKKGESKESKKIETKIKIQTCTRLYFPKI